MTYPIALEDPLTVGAVSRANTRFYELLMRVRPCQLAEVLKTCLHIRRRSVLTRTGHTFYVDPVSVFGISLMRYGIHETQMTKLLYALLRPSDTFLDVGGNEGYFSVIASTLVPDGAVHCIEPQQRLHSVLRKHFELNGSTMAVAHRTALSDRDGSADLFVRPSTNTGASSMFRYWKVGTATETVPCTTLDAFFDRNHLDRVRLMKVDCEGAESLVVAGGRNVLKRGGVASILSRWSITLQFAAPRCARPPIRLSPTRATTLAKSMVCLFIIFPVLRAWETRLQASRSKTDKRMRSN
jgi:FkbM family methyltransferase